MNYSNLTAQFRTTFRQVPFPARRRFLAAQEWFAVFALLASVSARAATVTWVGSNGDWGDASNWSGGAVPGQMDDVVIDPSNGTITVTISSETAQVNSVTCEETLLLNGGTISGGTVTTENGASLVVQSGALDGVTVNGVLDVGNTYSGASLTVYGGLVLNGTALVGNPNVGQYWTATGYGAIGFAGNQVLGGSGTVVFGNDNPWGNSMANALWVVNAGTTLVLGPGITVRGQNGVIGAAGSPWNGPANVSVANQGTISADVNGGTIAVNAQPLVNNGTVAMSDGGSLNINYLPSLAGLSISGNGILTLNGNWENNQTLSASGATLTFNGNWTNAGTMNVSGGSLTLNGNWANEGGITVNGGSLTLNGSWPSTGIINATNSGINLGGSFTLQSLQALNAVDCGFALVGTLNNVNTTLLMDGAVNGWELQGGEIYGGTVLMTNGASLLVQSGTLDGVTVNGVLDVGNRFSGASLTVYDGLVLNGTALVGAPNVAQTWNLAGYGGIGFAGNQELGGNGTVVFGNDNPSGNSPNALWVVNAGTTLVIGPGITVRGQNGVVGAAGSPWNGPANVSVANQGTISADVNGGMIAVNAQPLVNSGTVAMSNGGSLNINYLPSLTGLSISGNGALTLNGNWENDQTLSASGAALTFNGSWTNAGTMNVTGGSLTLNGNWANEGGITVNGGSLTLNGSWPSTGIINATNSSINLGGSFTLQSLQALNAVGCGFALVGTLNNANTTLLMDGAVNGWELQGGEIYGGTVLMTNGASLLVQSGTLDGVTVNGVLDVGNRFSGASLYVYDGLVLNGTALVGNPNVAQTWNLAGYGGIGFAGNQVLGGSGTVVFGNDNPPWNSMPNALWVVNAGTTLVIGPEITVRGQNGVIGAAVWPWNGPANVSVANQGTISEDVNGGMIALAGSSFNNSGQLLASASGGSIKVTADTVNTGLVEADNGAITFSGHFAQNTGSMGFGLSSPIDYGQIDLDGPVSVTLSGPVPIGGSINSQLDDGYVPNPGDSFAVLNYGTNLLAFTNLSLAAGVAWTNYYSQGVLTLVAKGILPIGVTVSPTSQTVAVGTTVSFKVATSGPGPFGFQWLQNGVAIAGATNAILVLTNVAVAGAGAYTVQVSNKSGSVSSSAAELTVLGPPAITTGPQSQTVGVGTTVTFPVTVAGTPPLSYQWSFDGQAVPGATNAFLTLTNVTRAQAGNYSVVITNIVGSVTSAAAAVLSIATGPCPGTPSGMVAWWRGEGNTGDYAGTNDAVFEGAAGYGPGEVGQAFLFDGATSYLQVPNNPLWAFGTNDFSIEFWVNFSVVFASDITGDGSTAFLGQDEGPGARNKWFFGFGGGLLYFYIRGPALPATLLAQASFAPLTNQWYHLGLTKASSVYRTYVNGGQVSVETNSLAVPAANAPLTIGQAQGYFMDGLLDEISLYDRALAENEIRAIFNAGTQGKCGLESGIPITLQAQVGSNLRVIIRITGGQAGATLTIEASEDLKQWSVIGSLVKSVDPDSFVDPTPVLPAARYYRVR